MRSELLAATSSGIVWGISCNASGASVVVFWRWTTTLHGWFVGPSLPEYSSSSNPSLSAEKQMLDNHSHNLLSFSLLPFLSFLHFLELLVTMVTWLSFPYWFKECSACIIEGNLLLDKTLTEMWRATHNVTIPSKHDKKTSMLLTPALLPEQSPEIIWYWVYVLLHTNLQSLWLVTCSIINLNGCILEENISSSSNFSLCTCWQLES